MSAPSKGPVAAEPNSVFPDALLPALQEALGLSAPADMPADEALHPAFAWYRDRCVLVTGAGGSIGSELCRQLLRLEPAKLILLERDEYSLFEIDRQLRSAPQASAVERIPLLADLRHAGRVEEAFRRHRPQIVLHAAACKHVPLLEENAAEAVSTNIGGTRVLLNACLDAAVERCLLVSTDKAVQPSSRMGATKRVNEWMFAAAGDGYRWVRLGNVLGSRGSVVPLFREQICQGGPVLLTDPRMTRYFIGLRPAAHGILLATALESRTRHFLLEMGAPVPILALAQTMIHLLANGQKPEIRITGPRSGERLHEQLLEPGERALPSLHPGLLGVAGGRPVPPRLFDDLRELEESANQGDEEAVRHRLTRLLCSATAMTAFPR